MPKQPKKNFFQYVDQSMVLCFLAVLNTKIEEWKGRKFTINYYINNDSIQINESEERNSGIMGGKFLAKKRYQNADNSGYITPGDLLVNSDIVINKWKFHITECAPKTKTYYSEVLGIEQA